MSDIAKPTFWNIQTQLSRRIAAGGGKVFVPRPPSGTIPWPYTLNFRQGEFVQLEFEIGTTLSVRFPSSLGSAPAIDMTGSNRCELDGPRMALGVGSVPPACGVFLGREYYRDRANGNRLSGCEIIGEFGNGHEHGGACVANVGSEVYRFTDRCNWRFKGRKGGAYYTSAYNEHRITSPHGVIAGGFTPGRGGAQSNAGGVIDGACHFACDEMPAGANPDDRYIVKLGSRTHSVWLHDAYLTAKTPGSLAASFVFGDEGDQAYWSSGVNNIVIANIHDEAYAARWFVRLDGKTRAVRIANSIVQAGMLVGHGHDASKARWQDGVSMDVYHRPHPAYWSGGPLEE